MAVKRELKRELEGQASKAPDTREESLVAAAERIARLGGETSVTFESWTLRGARARFSYLFREVVEGHRPQRIERRGGEAVVVVSEKDFLALLRPEPLEIPLADYFRAVAGADESGLEPLARTASRDLAKL